MRQLSALALLLSCFALGAHAQRGSVGHGGGAGLGGGMRGGFGSSAPHVGFGAQPRSFGTAGGYGTLRPGLGASGLRSATGPFGYGFRSYGPRAGSNHILRGPGHYPGRIPYGYGGYGYGGYGYGGYGYGYGGLGYGAFGYGYPGSGFGYPITPFWDFGDSLGYDASPYTGFAGESYTDGPSSNDPYQGYGGYPAPEQDPGQAQAPADAPYTGAPGDGSQPMVYAPYPYNYPSAPPQVVVVTPPAPLREEDAITLFYKDGRPPEQIRNYALTRTSLLVTGDRMREIPLADLDLPLTVRVNRAAGVDFQLPAAQ